METEQTTQTNQNNPPVYNTAAPQQNAGTYQGWLNSNSFLKRAFAIWGHHFVANFIIGFVVMLFMSGLFAVIGFSLFPLLRDAGSFGSMESPTQIPISIQETWEMQPSSSF